MVEFDSREFRRVLGHYPTGVCVVTALRDSAPIGMIVGSFTSVSLDPPLVAFLPDRSSTTWPLIRAAEHFCVNVLAEDQEDVCKALSARTGDRFAAIPHRLSRTGLPILDGVVAWIECRLHAVHEAGDHFIAIGRVRALEVARAHPPLAFVQGTYGRVVACETDKRTERLAA